VPALWAFTVIAFLTYFGTWWAWYGSETGIDRHLAEDGGGFWGATVTAIKSLAQYHDHVLQFHQHLHTDPAHQHPWESKPWTWPMGLRPMLYYYASGDKVTGCGTGDCISAVMLIGTPALWWPAIPVLVWSIWRAVTRVDWRYGAVLVGYGAGVVPWLANINRQMYFFYMAPVAPFLVLAIVLVMGEILGRGDAPWERRQTGLLAVGLWVGLAVANFAYLWPILVGVPITPEAWDAQLWLPSWRP